MNYITFDYFKNKVVVDYKLSDDKTKLQFKFSDGTIAEMSHIQDCCESVWLEDVTGDLDDLVGELIFDAQEDIVNGENTGWCSSTFSFYHLRTRKDTITIRWTGTSNGYYSETVDFFLVDYKDSLFS